jgi:predicted RNA-binding protein associated with RNAse of E/G family
VIDPGRSITIHKCDPTGGELRRWPALVLHSDPTSLQVEAHYDANEVDRFGLFFRKGDRLQETYFVDRWYNVFAVYDVTTKNLKGWYCNISRPARFESGDVYWEDLGLDVVVLPDRRASVLDEDEFDDMRLTEQDRLHARQAAAEILRRAESGPWPPAAVEPDLSG